MVRVPIQGIDFGDDDVYVFENAVGLLTVIPETSPTQGPIDVLTSNLIITPETEIIKNSIVDPIDSELLVTVETETLRTSIDDTIDSELLVTVETEALNTAISDPITSIITTTTVIT